VRSLNALVHRGLLQLRVGVKLVQHVGLLVVVRREHHEDHDVFEDLEWKIRIVHVRLAREG
jgi:hypothetical protein